MQHIKNILELPISSRSQTNVTMSPQKTTSLPLSSEKRLDSRRIDVLFSKFAAFYGHIWRSQFKDEVFLTFAKKEWKDALHEFSDVTLSKAISNCREFYEMPPTLAQMILSCRQLKKQSSAVEELDAYVPAKPEIALFHLQKCKAMLGK